MSGAGGALAYAHIDCTAPARARRAAARLGTCRRHAVSRPLTRPRIPPPPRPSEYLRIFNLVLEATHARFVNPYRPLTALWDKKARAPPRLRACCSLAAAGKTLPLLVD